MLRAETGETGKADDVSTMAGGGGGTRGNFQIPDFLWAGDFNRHHPLWDRDQDIHLFTQQANRNAQNLIGLLATYDLAMARPKGIPTLQHMVTKRYSRPNNVFNTAGLTDLITKCEVDPTLRPTSTDHFPILTNISLPQERTDTPPTHNFREADWDIFKQRLEARTEEIPNLPTIDNLEQLESAADLLTQAIQATHYRTNDW